MLISNQNTLSISTAARLQSSHLHLQAAGSTGADGSAQGIHLRWALQQQLGDQHLPKGDSWSNLNQFQANTEASLTEGSTPSGFNKTDDWVRVYRFPYQGTFVKATLSVAPSQVDHTQRLWEYTERGDFQLRFLDPEAYAGALRDFDPLQNPSGFLTAYGPSPMELTSASGLFFEAKFDTGNPGVTAELKTEILSDGLVGEPAITARKTFSGAAAGSAILSAENGLRVRFSATNCQVQAISFALYEVNLQNAIANNQVEFVGKYALSLDTQTVYEALEPGPNVVHGKWPRFNDESFVNVNNYKDRWDGTPADGEANLQQTVQRYLNLSHSGGNPLAVDTLTYTEDGEQQQYEISYLDLIQVASFDFHIARMLGLGTLDLGFATPSGRYIYVAEYITEADLGEGEGAQTVQHLSLSLPTGLSDERLPLPIALQEPLKGLRGPSGQGSPLTDAEGYSLDGKVGAITLLTEPLPEYDDTAFYESNTEYAFSDFTFPAYVGLEYKKQDEPGWRKLELSNHPEYQSAVPAGQTAHNEPAPMAIPEPGQPLYVHRQTDEGVHVYGSYSVNWFGRAAASPVTHMFRTTFPRANSLRPPAKLAPLLIREEGNWVVNADQTESVQGLLLTSQDEQLRLREISGADKTLVRLTFDYDATHELKSYKLTEEDLAANTNLGSPNAIYRDDREVFAETAELFFRDHLPKQVLGKVKQITSDPGNPVLAIVRTEGYPVYSSGTTLDPQLDPADFPNFIGGVLVVEEDQFMIHSIEPSTVAGEGPIFTVYKQEISDSVFQGTGMDLPADADFKAPEVRADGKIMAIENMVNSDSWGTPNPNSFTVQLHANPIHREVIEEPGPDEALEKTLEKSRGIWDTATVAAEPSASGVYRVTFDTTVLANHTQYQAQGNSVQWHGGSLRIHTAAQPNGRRRSLEVVKILNLGSTHPLELLVADTEGSGADSILTNTQVSVNYYPGYRVYLYANTADGLTHDKVLPAAGEETRYTLWGIRVHDTDDTGYRSKIGVPRMMFAQEVLDPKVPEAPLGAEYTTRPDSFGKSTYTLTTQFAHDPHGILYYRADELQVLRALYAKETVAAIVEELKKPEQQPYLVNRWKNLLGFDYTYDPFSTQTDGLFSHYPDQGFAPGYRLPNPDNPALFPLVTDEGVTVTAPGTTAPGIIINAMKEAIYTAFTPLTELPLLYHHIRTQTDYVPHAGKQRVRDRNGALLNPKDPDSGFDIAPMAKRTAVQTVQFTDFGIDGTSGSFYFYTVREVGNTMQMGDHSPVLGPIKPVNAQAPEAPHIRRSLPVFAQPGQGVDYQLRFEINRYPEVANIRRLCLYRTLDPAKSLSTRTMELVSTVDLASEGLLDANLWSITDDFADLPFIPFGDPLYYRVVVQRAITYADKDQQLVEDFVPSQQSTLVVSNLVESTEPTAPQLSFAAGNTTAAQLSNVTLSWDKTVHNGTYRILKQNSAGQWEKIHELADNSNLLTVALNSTDLLSDTLPVQDEEGNPIYHRFRVDVENTGGLLSEAAPVLTIGQ